MAYSKIVNVDVSIAGGAYEAGSGGPQPPVINIHPQSAIQDDVFTPIVLESKGFYQDTIQWYMNGIIIPDATEPNYVVEPWEPPVPFTVRADMNLIAGDVAWLNVDSRVNPNFTIDWGDGTVMQYLSYDPLGIQHTYPDPAGVYEIKILPGIFSDGLSIDISDPIYTDILTWGTTPIVSFEAVGSSIDHLPATCIWATGSHATFGGLAENLLTADVSDWDVSGVTSFKYLFKNCSSLTTLDFSDWDTSSVTDMYESFWGCPNLTTLDVSSWDTSSVTRMDSLFGNCSGLTILDVSSWDTSSVTRMDSLFGNCSGLTTLDVSGWVTSSVTRMEGLFGSCSGLTTVDVSNFDTSSVIRMDSLFSDCSGLTTLDATSFDTSSVTDMSGMFRDCTGLTTLDVTSFDTSSATSMWSMFNGCSGLTTLDVTGFDTSRAARLDGIFRGCLGLTTLDVTGFDTSSVTTLGSMFYDCSGLTTLDVTGFVTSSVTNMKDMFLNCTGLTTLDVTGFDTSSVIDMRSMFKNCTTLTTIDPSGFSLASMEENRMATFATGTPVTVAVYDACLTKWAADVAAGGITDQNPDFNLVTPTNTVDRQSLIDAGWLLSDADIPPSPMITPVEPMGVEEDEEVAPQRVIKTAPWIDRRRTNYVEQSAQSDYQYGFFHVEYTNEVATVPSEIATVALRIATTPIITVHPEYTVTNEDEPYATLISDADNYTHVQWEKLVNGDWEVIDGANSPRYQILMDNDQSGIEVRARYFSQIEENLTDSATILYMPSPTLWFFNHGFNTIQLPRGPLNTLRSTEASYIDENGELQIAPPNTLRHEYVLDDTGVLPEDRLMALCEGDSENLAWHSEEATGWQGLAGAISPVIEEELTMGDIVSTKLTFNYDPEQTLDNGVVRDLTDHTWTIPTGSPSAFTCFIWLDRPLVGTETLTVSQDGDLAGTPIVLDATNSDAYIGSFQRTEASVTANATVDSVNHAQIATTILDSPLVVYVSRLQCEVLPFATSYIKTAGASAFRERDSIYFETEGNLFSTPRTAFARVKCFGSHGDFPRVFSTSNDPNEWMLSYPRFRTDELRFQDGDTPSDVLNAPLNTLTTMGMVSEGTTVQGYANGVAGATSPAVENWTPIDLFSIGMDFSGHIADVMLFNLILNPMQMEHLHLKGVDISTRSLIPKSPKSDKDKEQELK